MNLPVLHCLTLDGIALSHEEQVQALCAAGASSIQVRMKQADDAEVAAVVTACLPVCRAASCRLIVNDRLEVALQTGADGVHLGKQDMAWADAAILAAGRLIIGGTVNSAADAEAAVASGVLDYVGVGPFRMTRTKQHLAPVLTSADWQSILNILGAMPAYAIGGIIPADIAGIRARGLHGAAVCARLYRNRAIARNYQEYMDAWNRVPDN